MEIGARTLSSEARPVSVSAFTLSDEASRIYTLGLFLPGGYAEDPSVVIPAGLYDPSHIFALRFEDREHTVQVKRLIMSTRSLDWFEIHVDRTDREYALSVKLPQ